MGLMSDFRTRVDDVGWSARVIFNEFMKFNIVGCFNSAFAFLLYLMLYQINLWDAHGGCGLGGLEHHRQHRSPFHALPIHLQVDFQICAESEPSFLVLHISPRRHHHDGIHHDRIMGHQPLSRMAVQYLRLRIPQFRPHPLARFPA